MVTSLVFVLFATVAQQRSACEGLKSLSLPNAIITTAELRTAGVAQPARGRGAAGAALPAHCRVAAVLTPSSDSHIEMELWMPVENWNGKFLAVGNGGWAGTIETGAMGTALARGYATASNDTGHNRSNGTEGAFALGHPEKVIDFGYRSMHEMTVHSKTSSSRSTGKVRDSRITRVARPVAVRAFPKHSAIPKTSTRSSPVRPFITKQDFTLPRCRLWSRC